MGRRVISMSGTGISRRTLLVAGSAAVAGMNLGPAGAMQGGTPFAGEASITSWGFGAEETNPMAFTRIEAFREAYPNIELELVPAEVADQQLLTAFASGELPDLLWLDRARLASWAERGVLMPLNDFFAESGIDTSKYYPSAIDQVTIDGQIYGLPQFTDVRALYVNLDALGETGQDAAAIDTGDWNALAELGAQLVVSEGDRVDRWGFDHKMQAGWIWMWGLGNGGQFISEDGTTLTLDDPNVVEALEWGVDAYERQGGFQRYEAVATTWQGDEQFARGQVAMTLYENWMLGIIARVAPDLNFTVLPLNKRGTSEAVSLSGGPAWCIPDGAPNPEAAWAFIEFMDRTDTWRIGAAGVKEVRTSEGSPYIPSLTANSEADQMQIDEFYEPIAEQFDAAVNLWPQILEQSQVIPVSKSPASSQILDIMQQEGVLPALRGEQPAAEALAEANEAAQRALDEASE